jgi:hypothetical protein
MVLHHSILFALVTVTFFIICRVAFGVRSCVCGAFITEE